MKFLNYAMQSCFGFPIQNRVIDTALVAAWIRRMEDVELVAPESCHDTRFDAVAIFTTLALLPMIVTPHLATPCLRHCFFNVLLIY